MVYLTTETGVLTMIISRRAESENRPMHRG
jgi:hypothetical protein